MVELSLIYVDSKDSQFQNFKPKINRNTFTNNREKLLSKFSIFLSLSSPKSLSMLDHSSFSFLSLLNRLKWNDLVTLSCQCKLAQVKGYELTHHSPGASIRPGYTTLIALMIIVSFTLMSLKAKAVECTVKLDLSKDGSWRSHLWN